MKELKPYPSYHEGRMDLHYKVPSHWKTSRLGRFLRAKGGSGFPEEHQGNKEQTIPFLKVANLGSDAARATTTDPEHYVSNETARLLGAEIFKKGTVVFAKVGAALLLERYKLLQEDSCIDNNLMAIKNSQEVVLNGYVRYFLATISLDRVVNPGAIPSINASQVHDFTITIPPIAEQNKITAFLDRETSKIDSLISEQEQLIELLQEKRQAVISNAVTKGLRPNTPMKDSEVKWLGEVPKHWEMKALKRVSPKQTVGIVVNPSLYVSGEGLPFIYGGDIREEAIDLENCRRISREDSLKQRKTIIEGGDLVTVRVGAPGVTAVVPEAATGGNCASVMLTKKGDFDSRWLCYLMNSKAFRHQVEVVQYGAAQEQFNISHAVEFTCPTPPIEEQKEIADYLYKTCQSVDQLKAQVDRSIMLMKERRSALISAAVTGQIDIRGLVYEKEEAA